MNLSLSVLGHLFGKIGYNLRGQRDGHLGVSKVMWVHAGLGHNSPGVRWDRSRMCKPGAATGSQQGKKAVVRADAKQVGGWSL